MNFKILTLFPEAFPGPFNQSIMGKALKKNFLQSKPSISESFQQINQKLLTINLMAVVLE